MAGQENERLIDAVTYLDTDGVREALAAGADANFQIEVPDGYAEDIEQPSTPLKLVMFRISDSFVDDDGLRALTDIARLLLDHGADPFPAMAIAEARYGAYDPTAEGHFADVWHTVARAANGDQEA